MLYTQYSWCWLLAQSVQGGFVLWWFQLQITVIAGIPYQLLVNQNMIWTLAAKSQELPRTHFSFKAHGKITVSRERSSIPPFFCVLSHWTWSCLGFGIVQKWQQCCFMLFSAFLLGITSIWRLLFCRQSWAEGNDTAILTPSRCIPAIT